MNSSSLDITSLPHRPPMRLVNTLTEVVPGKSACATRTTHPDDWYFQGHFPGDPIVPAVILIELLAQTGGLAAGSSALEAGKAMGLRLAATGPFKFFAPARPNQLLEAHARVSGRIGGLVRIEGEVFADGLRVAAGDLTLAAIKSEQEGATAE